MERTHRRWAFVLLLATAAAARMSTLNAPFLPNHEGTVCGPLLCVARNHVRYGPFASRLAGIMNAGEVAPENRVVYAHHPPLVPLVVAASLGILGEADWTARLPAALFSVACTALVFLMMERRFGWKAALAAGFIHAWCPFTLIFGGMPDFVGPPLVFFGLLAVESYLRWREDGRARWYWGMAGALILGALADWPIFFLPPVLLAHYLIRRERPSVPRMIAFAAGSVVLFVGIALWASWARSDVSIFELIRHRVAGETDRTGFTIGFAETGEMLLRHVARLHSYPVAFLALVYLVLVGVRIGRRSWTALAAQEAPLILLGWSLLHLVIGRQGNYQHAWWAAVVTPALACSAALAIEVVRRRRVVEMAIVLAAPILAGLSAGAADQYRSKQFNDYQNRGYTLHGLGRVIRKVSKDPAEGVLTSDWSDDSTWLSEPPLWWYGDRQIRNAIINPEDLEWALKEGPYPLYYDYWQESGPAPSWFVLPGPHHATLPRLAAELDRRFPDSWNIDGFKVYWIPP